jgi:hypothetical protein
MSKEKLMFILRHAGLGSALAFNLVFAACGSSSTPAPATDARSSAGGTSGTGGTSGAGGTSSTGGTSGNSGTGGTSGTSGTGGSSGAGGRDGGGSGTARGPAAVNLGAAGTHVVLAESGISTVPTSHVTGDIGLSPMAASFLTGFSLVADSTNVFSTSTQVVGKIFAADYAPPTSTGLTTAVSNMEAAYTDAAGRPTPDFLELGTGNIGGMTLVPGLYKWTSTVTVPTDLTIAGPANAVWIFQTSGDLTVAAAKIVTLSGGAQAKNIFWQVAGRATFGANSHFEGVVLCKTAITLETGATMNGRALAQTQVALEQATITQPAP